MRAYLDGRLDDLPARPAGHGETNAAEREIGKATLTAPMGKSELAAIKRKAQADGVSMSELARGWIRGYVS